MNERFMKVVESSEGNTDGAVTNLMSRPLKRWNIEFAVVPLRKSKNKVWVLEERPNEMYQLYVEEY